MLSDAHTVHHVCAPLDKVLPALVLVAVLDCIHFLECSFGSCFLFPKFISYAVVYLYLVCFYFYRARLSTESDRHICFTLFRFCFGSFLFGTRCDIFL